MIKEHGHFNGKRRLFSINGTGIAAHPHAKKKKKKTVSTKTTNYIQTIYLSQNVTQNYHKFITNLVLKYKTVKGIKGIEILGHLGFGDDILIPKHCLLPRGHCTVHERKNCK